jgi:selenocysteine-specific elongation factor
MGMRPESRSIILGTAGHIDHGKTAFIKALTGIECDLLQEEKRRGITIVLGYAHMRLPSGIKVGIVDVPGHERFVNRMVAGAAGIDVVALLVAADERIKPQTLEHLYICEILGIRKGIVVLNKKDLVDDEMLLLQMAEIEKFTAGTFLEGAPIIPVSSVTGEGLDEFAETLEQIAVGLTVKPGQKPFRLPVDAVVTITGFGTVVRGTALSGKISAGEEVMVMPKGRRCRIRGIHNHGTAIEEGFAGERLALNLADAKKEEIIRGMVVVRPDTYRAGDTFLVEFNYLHYNKRPLRQVSHGQFHVLAAKVDAEMELLQEEELPPGARTVAVVKTAQPVSVACGDSFVVRGYGLFTTIGGGRILHPAFSYDKGEYLEEYIRTLSTGSIADRIALFVRDSSEGIRMPALCGILNEAEDRIAENVSALKRENVLLEDDGRRLFHRRQIDALQRCIGRTVRGYHGKHDLRMGMGKEELLRKTRANPEMFDLALSLLGTNGFLEIEGDFIRWKGFAITDESSEGMLLASVEKAFLQYGLKADFPDDAAKSIGLSKKRLMEALNTLTKSGRLVRLSEEYFLHPEHIETVKDFLKSFFKDHSVLTPQDIRERFDITRKYIIPMLEYLDGAKVTVRTPEGRKLLLLDRN